MADIIDLDSRRPGWCVHQWRCPVCGHEEVAVYHESSNQLECGECGQMIGLAKLKEFFPWIGNDSSNDA